MKEEVEGPVLPDTTVFQAVTVNIGTIQTCRKCLWVYFSQTNDNARTQILSGLRNAPKNGSLAPYFMQYNQKRRPEWVTRSPLVID